MFINVNIYLWLFNVRGSQSDDIILKSSGLRQRLILTFLEEPNTYSFMVESN